MNRNNNENIFILTIVFFFFFQIFLTKLLNSINKTNEQSISVNNHIYLLKNKLIERMNINITEVIILFDKLNIKYSQNFF